MSGFLDRLVARVSGDSNETLRSGTLRPRPVLRFEPRFGPADEDSEARLLSEEPSLAPEEPVTERSAASRPRTGVPSAADDSAREWSALAPVSHPPPDRRRAEGSSPLSGAPIDDPVATSSHSKPTDTPQPQRGAEFEPADAKLRQPPQGGHQTADTRPAGSAVQHRLGRDRPDETRGPRVQPMPAELANGPAPPQRTGSGTEPVGPARGDSPLAGKPGLAEQAQRPVVPSHTAVLPVLDAQPRPAAPTAPTAQPTPPSTPTSEPTIRVTVGRVEVRAVTPPTPSASPAAERTGPALSLDDYLKQRDGERR